MPKRHIYWLLIGFLVTACGTGVEPTGSSENFHYTQMEALAASEKREMALTNLYGGVDRLEGRVDARGRIVFQGDMIIGLTGRLGEQATFDDFSQTKKWPNKTVPYELADDLPGALENNIREAIATFNRETNVQWVKHTDQKNYVRFVHDQTECSSYVGMVEGTVEGMPEGAQPLRLTERCGYRGALHELGHAVGLHHEHVRPDRNDYIRLDCGLIETFYRDGCDKAWAVKQAVKPYEAYDYYSIMHYPACLRYFDHKGKETCTEYVGDTALEDYQVIFPRKAGVDHLRIGRENRLTNADIAGINYLYPKASTPDKAFSSAIVAHHSGKCLDVPGWKVQSDVQLMQWSCNRRDNQLFDFSAVEGKPNIYTIRNRLSGKCVNLAARNHDNGVPVMQTSCTGEKNQQFELRAKSGGGYQIVAQHTQKCLDVTDKGMSDGAKLRQWFCYARTSEIQNQVFYVKGMP